MIKPAEQAAGLSKCSVAAQKQQRESSLARASRRQHWMESSQSIAAVSPVTRSPGKNKMKLIQTEKQKPSIAMLGNNKEG